VKAYKDSSDALLRDLKARIVPFPKVGHAELVQRALAPIKPFVESGRGYRDALIWYTILELLQATTSDLVFVSQNSEDWCGKHKEEFVFHSDLLEELHAKGVSPGRLALVPTLAEFNHKYTVSKLSAVPAIAAEMEKPIDYDRLLVDRQELVANQLLDAVPNSLRRVGANVVTIGEFGVLGLSRPLDVEHEPPRILDSERRLLQFSAQYRLTADFVIPRAEALWWTKRFVVQLRRDWDFGNIVIYATVPIKASFHMIERGEKIEQFSLASAEVSE